MMATLAFKDTHREKAPSNTTQAVTKSMNMDIWIVILFIYLKYLLIIYLKLTNLHNICINYTIKIAK